MLQANSTSMVKTVNFLYANDLTNRAAGKIQSAKEGIHSSQHKGNTSPVLSQLDYHRKYLCFILHLPSKITTLEEMKRKKTRNNYHLKYNFGAHWVLFKKNGKKNNVEPRIVLESQT
jgi:beta-galactosidase beta subunit